MNMKTKKNMVDEKYLNLRKDEQNLCTKLTLYECKMDIRVKVHDEGKYFIKHDNIHHI